MALGTKRSLLLRLVSAQRFLAQSLDSLWFCVTSAFSKPQATSVSQEEQREKRRWWKIPLEVFAVLAAVVGVIGVVLSLVPKISVGVSGSLQPTNPMKTVFFISNDGSLPIHDILAVCQLERFKAGNFQLLAEGEGDGGFTFPESSARTLSPGHPMTLPCAHLIGVDETAGITDAEMTIIVGYRPDYVWWRQKERFPFKAEKAHDGTWVWKSVPR